MSLQSPTAPSATPAAPSALRVWFVHDWLTGMRGGEKVLLELVKLFPNSRIATLIHVPGASHPELDKRVVAVSFLNSMPAAKTNWRNYLPLYPRAVRSLQIDNNCDVVISVSHAVAKGIRVPSGMPHICYCLTPMRYIWGMEDQYLSRYSWKRAALAAVKPYLRRFDRKNGDITRFVVLSRAVAQRVRRRYGLDSTLIYPGIDEKFYTPLPASTPREDFYLMVGAMVGYKRMDLAIEIFANPVKTLRRSDDNRARKLKVIGAGPEEPHLRALAGNSLNVEFLGRQPDEVVRDHYRRCRAFIFPGEEDFGLTVVEAQACGAPVIAYRAGGATETVIDGQTGLFFDRQERGHLWDAVDRFEDCRGSFVREAARENALRFTWDNFRKEIFHIVNKTFSAYAATVTASAKKSQ